MTAEAEKLGVGYGLVVFTVVYDPCVLHPAPLRDLFVRAGKPA